MSLITDKITDLKNNALKKIADMDDIKDAGIPFGCLDEYSTKIMDLISNSSAFKNSKQFFIDATNSAISNLKDFLNNISDADLPEGWTSDDIKKLLAKLDIFSGSLDAFKEWTDHLSGLIEIDGMPGMTSLLNICNSMQKYLSCSGVDLPQSEEQAKLAFGSLLLDAAETESTTNYIDSIRRLMYDGNSVDDIISELERNQLIYDTSVYRDKENINDFTQTLINQNTALNISGMNMYETGYDLMLNTIASDELKSFLIKT